MTKREEFMSLIQSADPNTLDLLLNLLKLGTSSPGFMAALAEATPPGEECPPANVMRNLVNEWAEREGLK